MNTLTHAKSSESPTPDWHDLGHTKTALPDSKKIGKTTIQVFVSPYDVPEAMRGCYNRKSHIFLIEFRYVGGEESLEERVEAGITLKLGRHSGRVHGIEVDTTKIDGDSIDISFHLRKVISRVEIAIESLEAPRRSWLFRAEKPYAPENYRMTRQIIEENADWLSHLVSASCISEK